MLEVRSSGGKTYYQRYVDPRGRQRQFKIGSGETLPLQRQELCGPPRRSSSLSVIGVCPTPRRTGSWHIDEVNLRHHVLPARSGA
jgi:hypothetical protein